MTPSAVVSPVSTGWLNEVCTKDWAARLYTSSGRYVRRISIIETWSSRSPVTIRTRSWMWVMRS